MRESTGVRVRRIGLAGSLALFAAGFGVLGSSSGSARMLSVGYTVKPVTASEKWIRVSVTGTDALDLFALQGVDFEITGIKSVRASGVPAPACAMAGVPPTLTCVGHMRTGASVFLNVSTSGEGGSFKFARASAGASIDLVAPPAMAQGDPLLPIAARMTRGTGTKTVIFSGQTTSRQVEILPTSAFRIGKVTAVTAGGKARPVSACKPEGDGIDCKLTLPTGSIGKVTFAAPRTNARSISGRRAVADSVEVLLQGDGGTGDRYVAETNETPVTTYDLVTYVRPVRAILHTRRYEGGQLIMEFGVRNATTAKRASRPGSAVITAEGPNLLPTKVCALKMARVPALKPGEELPVCSLTMSADTLVQPGAFHMVLTVTCVASLERSCTNNRARGEIVVKRP